MSSWTEQQVTILMEWLNENEENAEKTIWAQRYYDFLYVLMFVPGVIINSIIASVRNECDNTSASQTILSLIIIKIALDTFDKAFNFGKVAGDFGQYSNMYQAFSDEIVEELAKPDNQKRNGTQFFHDMNIKKQRLSDKTDPVPWVIEKLWNYHKKPKNNLKEVVVISQNHVTNRELNYDQPAQDVPPLHKILRENSFRSRIRTETQIQKERAALCIQRYWWKYCIRKKKNIKNIKNKQLAIFKMYDLLDKMSNLPFISKNNVETASNTSYTDPAPPKPIRNKSVCHLFVENPQNKIQERLAKKHKEKEAEVSPADVQLQRMREYELNRFHGNFTESGMDGPELTHDNFIKKIANMR